MKLRLDSTDLQIINILQKDARITTTKLAAQIAMSRPATAERMRRLEEEGIIKGYQAIVDPLALGLNTQAYLVIEAINIYNRAEFYEYVHSHPEISRCDLIITGDKEALLHIFCRNNNHLLQIQSDLKKLTKSTSYIVASMPIKNAPITPVDYEQAFDEQAIQNTLNNYTKPK
ncbi:MAG: Lrp/AsnC family transcriptional regulator [Clostridia bacterium]|nr:Lrp/AsnC family transcriptional regulator [Clostridia bacterium]MDD4798739.1 Lrp/AsnC family transcriptional regulator [Clostridia bacterium]